MTLPLRCIYQILLVFVSLFILSPAFHTEFGPVDDHEIILMMGEDQKASWTELTAFAATKIKTDNSMGRSRPLYQVLRGIEAFLWGNNARLWIAARGALLLLSILLLFHLCARWLPLLDSFLLTLSLLAAPTFEVWFRLGPNESYAFLFLSVGAWLAVKNNPLGALMFALSGACKESFIPLAPLGLFLYPQWPKLRPLSNALIWIVSALVFAAVAGRTAWVMSEFGVQYGNSLNLSALSSALLSWLLTFVPVLAVSLLILFLRVVSSRRGVTRPFLFYVFLAFLVFASQCAVYKSGVLAGRYLLLFHFSLALFWALGAFLIRSSSQVLDQAQDPRPLKRFFQKNPLSISIALGLLMMHDAFGLARSYRENKVWTERNKIYASALSEAKLHLVSQARSVPHPVVFLQAAHPDDLEPVYKTAERLRLELLSSGINTFMLCLRTTINAASFDGGPRILAQSLIDTMNQGREEGAIQPLRMCTATATKSSCSVLSYSSDPDGTLCSHGWRAW